MESLNNYEKRVVSLLTAKFLSPDALKLIVSDAEVVDYEYTGSGYFLTVHHKYLPKERIVCSEPTVIGETDDITAGFLIFIENNELTIECHSWNEVDIPVDFRDKNVRINPVEIKDGKFIFINSTELPEDV
jgi:hypothetical protein